MIKNAVFIPASRSAVFAALTGYSKYEEWLPGCEQCTVVSVKGSTTCTEFVLNMSRTIRMGLRFDAEPDHILRFELTGGKELKTYAGLYRLMEATDRSGTVLFTELDMEVRSIPRFLTDGMAKKSLERAGIALKKYVEKLPAVRDAAPVAAPFTPAAPPARGARRLVQIGKLPAGYRIRILGTVLRVKNLPGNFFDR
jgi:uncharacterized protein YndB with AHSA1/START domain